MCSDLKSENEYSFDIDELLQIGIMCRQLKKEKDMLKESQSKSAEVIRILESDVKSLCEARSEDAQYIQQLKTELRNCSQETGYLQKQLNLRNIEANYLGEHVHSLQLKLTEMGNLREQVSLLKEELLKSNSERFFLMRELENKEMELQSSNLCVEKLEELISSAALESECEIESIKLDLIAWEQRSFEVEKTQEKNTVEKARMNGTIENLVVRFQESQLVIECLETENKELREKLEISERNVTVFVQKFEEHLKKWLGNKERSQLGIQSSRESELHACKEMGTCGEALGPLLSKLDASGKHVKGEMEKMLHQILEYEYLVNQLKEKLREEKSKAKEEAEDLTQEMAELRYQFTGMLEEECKRRVSIQQASLLRIAQLEAQLGKEQRESPTPVNHFLQVQKSVGSKFTEVHPWENVLEGSCTTPERTQVCNCGGC